MSRTVEGFADSLPKVAKAVGAILEGVASRVDVTPDIKVYECKDVIRIDLKITKRED